MTTSSPVNAANIDNILDSIFNDNPYKHDLKGRNFRGIPCDFDGLGLLPNDERILQHIIKRKYSNGYYKAKYKEIAETLGISKSTVRRSIARLKLFGLIIADRFDRGFKYMLTNFYRQIEKIIAIFGRLPIRELKKKYDQLLTERQIYIDQQQAENDHDEPERVFKMNTESVQNEHSSPINNRDFDREPTPCDDSCCEPIPEKRQVQASEQGSFPEINFDGHEDQIKESCAKINSLHKKKVTFPPLAMSIAMIGSGIPAKAVLKALNSMIKDWSIIDYNPVEFFKKRCRRHSVWLGRKEQIDNAREEERKSDEHKRLNQEFCDRGGIDSLYGF